MPWFDTTTDGTRLHHIDYGPADGPVLVFVNSTYFGTEMWERQMLPLAVAGYRCVSFDRRGHGRSDDVWGGFDLDTLADDLAAFLHHLDLRDVTLVAHSFGCAEAVRCLTRHGSGRVARIALVAGITPGLVRTPDNPDGLAPETVAAASAVIHRDRHTFFADGTDGFFGIGLPGNDISRPMARHLADRCAVATARGATGVVDLLRELDVAAELKDIDVPALVVHGTHDESAPLDLTGRRTAALLPGADLRIYEYGAHGLVFTHAERLNADLREFMAR
ncbi:alpha/beta fold hydrolase [Streptomyces sp. VRA16 Mangrove soil]|uniref:alpha/beta fold hydrolase n=1 Tax=Streptomyces sp. VRA16 Mangrove soil TaxID=2817434 RepID=UPI001A9D471F|nr:alpha/beta hydrolase [Streptomyces sp. VRA16 Mangrove soil]MBO1332917.1 alpha/beta hydrolase [Streptomyces sp. VRA16 Mangrove soil]